MKIFKAIALLATAAIFFACGDDSSTSANQSDMDQENISSSSIDETSSSSNTIDNVENSSSSSETESSTDNSSSENISSSSAENTSSSSIAAISSSSVEQQSSSSSEETDIADGDFYTLRYAASFEEKDGFTFISIVGGTCDVKNDVYTWIPNNIKSTKAYKLEENTLTEYILSGESVYYDDYFTVYTGNSDNIYSTWTSNEGQQGRISLQGQKILIKKDSVILTTFRNEKKLAETNMVNNMLARAFDQDEKYYNPDLKNPSILEDIPEYGITFSNQQMNSVTMDIHGQKFEIVIEESFSAKGIHTHQVVTSNNKTCEQNATLSHLLDGSNCNAENYTKLYGYRDYGVHKSSFSTITMQDVDVDDITFYDCIYALINEDNPIQKELD